MKILEVVPFEKIKNRHPEFPSTSARSYQRASRDEGSCVFIAKLKWTSTKIFLAALMVLTMASLSSAQQATADVVFINGDIFTAPDITAVTKDGMVPPFKTKIVQPRVQALAISGGKI
ncbi:MAG TPA: hypothetical protein VGR76_08775, partial [Candidatus Angelobacter sp.]|nr:hypothetical protein [Candidatus Angelobacter sp.]